MEYYLDCEFNLLIYGVGSKRKLINRFHDRIAMPKFVVNGYHAGTTIKAVLNQTTEFINEVVCSKNKKNRKTFFN
jgi:hypothetical protein